MDAVDNPYDQVDASGEMPVSRPWIWSGWSVYVVSYLGDNDRRDASGRLACLVPKLVAMGMTPNVCAGQNRLMAGHPTNSKIWLTHTAALHQHVLSANSRQPCLILEDDVEFVVDTKTMDAQLRRMVAFRPDFKLINLGALHAGLAVPIGGNLVVSQCSLLAHSILYSAKFAKQCVGQSKLIVPPDLGECVHALSFAERLAAFPCLTTQSEWPVCTPSGLRSTFDTFSAVHRITNATLMFAVPALVLVLVCAAVCSFVNAHATVDTGNAGFRHSFRNKGIAFVVVACALITGCFIALPLGVVSNGVSRSSFDAMEHVLLHSGFLNDFCPVSSSSPSASDCSPSGSDCSPPGSVSDLRKTSL